MDTKIFIKELSSFIDKKKNVLIAEKKVNGNTIYKEGLIDGEIAALQDIQLKILSDLANMMKGGF